MKGSRKNWLSPSQWNKKRPGHEWITEWLTTGGLLFVFSPSWHAVSFLLFGPVWCLCLIRPIPGAHSTWPESLHLDATPISTASGHIWGFRSLTLPVQAVPVGEAVTGNLPYFLLPLIFIFHSSTPPLIFVLAFAGDLPSDNSIHSSPAIFARRVRSLWCLYSGVCTPCTHFWHMTAKKPISKVGRKNRRNYLSGSITDGRHISVTNLRNLLLF